MNEVLATILGTIIAAILIAAFPRVVKYIRSSYPDFREKYQRYQIEKRKYDFTAAVLLSVQKWPFVGIDYPWSEWKARQWDDVIYEIYDAGAAGIPINYWGVFMLLTCNREAGIEHNTVPPIVPRLHLINKDGAQLSAPWQPVDDRLYRLKHKILLEKEALAAAIVESRANS